MQLHPNLEQGEVHAFATEQPAEEAHGFAGEQPAEQVRTVDEGYIRPVGEAQVEQSGEAAVAEAVAPTEPVVAVES